jgi:signal transduction histidine kinase
LRTTALGSEPYSNGNIPALLAAKQGADAAAKHAEEAMLAAQAADLAKTKFLANMAHELRTPLNAIIGFSEIIKLDNIQARERYPQYAEYIHDAGIPLLNIINGLLDLALMNFLPALRNGEAIAVGEGVAKVWRCRCGYVSVYYPTTAVPRVRRRHSPARGRRAATVRR